MRRAISTAVGAVWLLWPTWAGAARVDGGAARVDGDAADVADAAPAGADRDADASRAGPEAGGAQTLAPTTPAPPRVHLRGRVLERGTRQPLPNVTLQVDGAVAGETDEAGTFDVPVAPGPHELRAFASGHEPARTTIDDAADGAPPLTLRLEPRADQERYETVVHAAGEGAPRVSLEGDESRSVPGALGDPLRVLESLPGVSQVVWPAALYAIRGANPGNTGFFVDGTRVPTHFHFLLGPAVIHPYFLGGLDFYPGAYPVAFGRYTSGIVSARTLAPPADRVHADVDVRLYDAGALVTSPIASGTGTVAAAARYSYTGPLIALFSDQIDLWYADYQLRADRAFGGGKASLFVLGSFDSIDVSASGGGAGSLQFHRLTLRWVGPLPRIGARLDVALSGGFDRTVTTLLDSPIHVDAGSLAPRAQLSRPLGARAELQVGVDAELEGLAPQRPVTSTGLPQQNLGDITRRRGAASVAGYGALVLGAGTRLTVTPSFRLDAFAEQGVRRLEPGPRLFVRVQATKALALTAAGGRFSQMPSMPVAAAGLEAFDLATLGPQHSWQGSLSTELRPSDAWTGTVTGFYQRFRLSDLRSMLSADPQATGFLEMRDGRGYGLELMLRRPADRRLSGWLAYTLSKSTRDFDGLPGPSDWDQRHILNLVAAYRLGRSTTAGARFHYATGRPFPIFDDASRLTEYRRLPDFYQLDLRVGHRWIFDRFLLDGYAEVVNATRTRVVSQYTRSDVTGKVEEVGYRIFLPSVGVHAQF